MKGELNAKTEELKEANEWVRFAEEKSTILITRFKTVRKRVYQS